VAIQPGNTYFSDSMTDITKIPTANLGFSTSDTEWLAKLEEELVIWPYMKW